MGKRENNPLPATEFVPYLYLKQRMICYLGWNGKKQEPTYYYNEDGRYGGN